MNWLIYGLIEPVDLILASCTLKNVSIYEINLKIKVFALKYILKNYFKLNGIPTTFMSKNKNFGAFDTWKERPTRPPAAIRLTSANRFKSTYV